MTRKKTSPKAPEVKNLQEAQQVIDLLWQELQDIKDKLASNSSNSSRPPSSDSFSTTYPTRKSSGKKRGAQVGHKGSKREMADDVDTVHHRVTVHREAIDKLTTRFSG